MIDLNGYKLNDLLPVSIFSLQAAMTDVELVYKNGIYLYVFKEDWYYTSTKVENRINNFFNYTRRDKSTESDDLNNITTAEYLLLDIAKNSKNAKYLDIGTNYGQWIIRAMKILERNNAEIDVVSFEPGLSARLAVINLVFNNIKNVKFFPYAVSNVTSVIPFFAVKGHTEDNKFTSKPSNSLSFPSISVRIDDVLSTTSPQTELFLKIDTQGAEPYVMEGLGNDFINVAGILEFSPKVISAQQKPIKFLDYLLSKFYLIELDGYQNFKTLITLENKEEIFTRIWNNENHPWCDILIISKSHTRANELLKVIGVD